MGMECEMRTTEEKKQGESARTEVKRCQGTIRTTSSSAGKNKRTIFLHMPILNQIQPWPLCLRRIWSDMHCLRWSRFKPATFWFINMGEKILPSAFFVQVTPSHHYPIVEFNREGRSKEKQNEIWRVKINTADLIYYILTWIHSISTE